MTRQPIQGWVYTLREILEDLYLRDDPHLSVPAPKISLGLVETADWGPIQKNHFDYKSGDFLEKFGHLRFKYVRETFEWIPVFRFDGTLEEIVKSVDFEPSVDESIPEGLPMCWWITFKGHPREQYSKISICGEYVTGYLGEVPIPYQLKVLREHLAKNPIE